MPSDHISKPYLVLVQLKESIDYAIRGLISIVDCKSKPIESTIICSKPNISMTGELYVSRWADEYMDDIEGNTMQEMVYGEVS